MHQLRAIHVVEMPVGDPLGANGLCKAVLELSQAQGGVADVHIVVRGGWPDARPIPDMEIHGGRFIDCVRALRRLARENSVVHVHSVWSWLILAPLLVSATKSCRFVLSPHGVFASEALKTSMIKKRLFWPILRLALKRFHQFQSASQKEANELTRLAIRAPIAVVPNAVSEPGRPFVRTEKQKVVGCLGRIHPIKGTLDLARAWLEIEHDYPGWELQLVGTASDRSYLREIEAVAASSKTIRISPATDPSAAWTFLSQCELVAVPSRSENFCYVVAEAYLAGTAVVTTDQVPWPQVEGSDISWRGPAGVEGIRQSLRAALDADSKERRLRADRGRRFVRSNCGPDRIGRHSLDAYSAIAMPIRDRRPAPPEALAQPPAFVEALTSRAFQE